MDDVMPDRSLKRLRLDPKSLAEIVEILRRNDRRAIVKLDDHKIDDPAHADAAMLASAKSVDIVSYWTNPDRPTWGRRHFVYVASGPGGAQYFGDSMSPEVQTVLRDLDTYFGRTTLEETPAKAVAAEPKRPLDRQLSDPAVQTILLGIGLLIAVLSFLLGRWTVDSAPPFVGPQNFQEEVVQTPTQPATAPADIAGPSVK